MPGAKSRRLRVEETVIDWFGRAWHRQLATWCSPNHEYCGCISMMSELDGNQKQATHPPYCSRTSRSLRLSMAQHGSAISVRLDLAIEASRGVSCPEGQRSLRRGFRAVVPDNLGRWKLGDRRQVLRNVEKQPKHIFVCSGCDLESSNNLVSIRFYLFSPKLLQVTHLWSMFGSIGGGKPISKPALLFGAWSRRPMQSKSIQKRKVAKRYQ